MASFAFSSYDLHLCMSSMNLNFEFLYQCFYLICFVKYMKDSIEKKAPSTACVVYLFRPTELWIFHSLKDYLLLHVLLMDRIHETCILTTEFMPVVLLTDGSEVYHNYIIKICCIKSQVIQKDTGFANWIPTSTNVIGCLTRTEFFNHFSIFFEFNKFIWIKQIQLKSTIHSNSSMNHRRMY